MKNITNYSNDAHRSVMLNEVIRYLMPKDGEHILDCTFGAGGYSRGILDSVNCHITALDQDPDVQLYADALSNKYKHRFNFIHTNFADVLDKLVGISFDGIVMDLGVSSMQLDQADRGFAFMHDGPLDMRMNKQGETAANFVNGASEKEIANVIYRYGDENASRKIAKNIVAQRVITPITTTKQLADIVRKSIGFRKGKIDNATKTFQAIRIYINNELKYLEMFLDKVQEMLANNGRLVIISFHALEDRIIKKFFIDNAIHQKARSKYFKYSQHQSVESSYGWLKILTKKPISPSLDEIKLNYRCRSGKLRAMVKVL